MSKCTKILDTGPRSEKVVSGAESNTAMLVQCFRQNKYTAGKQSILAETKHHTSKNGWLPACQLNINNINFSIYIKLNINN